MLNSLSSMMFFKRSFGFTRSLFVRYFEGSIYRNLTELCTMAACSVMSVQRWMLKTCTFSYNICRNQRTFEHCKMKQELFRLVTMNCGQNMYKPPSCAARLRQMTMACGRITNYSSCVARQPLWHMIIVCEVLMQKTLTLSWEKC